MKTEDDLIRILKRAPYSDALVYFQEWGKTAGYNVSLLDQEFKKLGWEWEEFCSEYEARK